MRNPTPGRRTLRTPLATPYLAANRSHHEPAHPRRERLSYALTAEDIQFLATRKRRILTRLEGLSEAPASRALTDRLPITRGHSESHPPAGVNRHEDLTDAYPDRPPPRDRSLFDHYRWRFDRARGDLPKIELLCTMAERDYWGAALSGGRGKRPGGEDAIDRNRRIIVEYEGESAERVAVFEDMSFANVRRVRKEFGRDQGTGLLPYQVAA